MNQDQGQTVFAALSAAAEWHGDQTALLIDTHAGRDELTWADLLAATRIQAAALLRSGIQAGDNVAVMLGNRVEWVTMELALGAIGARLVPINTRFKAREVEFVLGQAEARAFFFEHRVASTDIAAVVEAAIPDLAGVDSRNRRSEAYPQLDLVVDLDSEALAGTVAFSSWADADSPDTAAVERAAGEVGPDQVLLIVYTSGTTGRPKGAMLSHRSVLTHMGTLRDRLTLTDSDRIFNAAPMFFVSGCVLVIGLALNSAAGIAMLDVFDADRSLAVCEDAGVTFLQGTPIHYLTLLRSPRFDQTDLSRVRVATIGGANVPVELVRELMERLDVDMVSSYGLSEAASCSTWTSRGDAPAVIATTVGKPAPDTEMRLVPVDPQHPVEPGNGAQGEVQLRGVPVMSGYFNAPDQTASSFDEGGWLRTGDLGELDADGNLILRGRSKDMFITGGINVYPAEIDDVLFEHPGVNQGYVVGVPHDRYGEVGVAYVEPSDRVHIDPEELRSWCAERLASYKVPWRFEVTDEFPLTASGKVKRGELLKRFQRSGVSVAAVDDRKR